METRWFRAKITGTFQLAQGTQLKVLVGQEGGTIAEFSDRPGGGGGGSFVTLMDDSPLIIAGGGGGGGPARDNFTDGDPGQATRNGSQCGGTQGGGGQVCNAQTGKRDPSFPAGGGAGVLGNGNSGMALGVAPLSFGTVEWEEKVRQLTEALVGDHSRLYSGEGVVDTQVGEYSVLSIKVPRGEEGRTMSVKIS